MKGGQAMGLSGIYPAEEDELPAATPLLSPHAASARTHTAAVISAISFFFIVLYPSFHAALPDHSAATASNSS